VGSYRSIVLIILFIKGREGYHGFIIIGGTQLGMVRSFEMVFIVYGWDKIIG